ncbi:Calx-beta domain-containing protein [Nostoc sp. TCL26-01]|uniref:Calx-beta domain-containing protein n=1 Tax=Nostoc sp. TCL26-01 TaxID=2576904 RepID=UPI0015BDFB36|nr:Calx-beta domain-containing protein [Nostoc sp. TCL26-01]QLE55097.1 hypothetical protein FD725_05970 [Nostoc sp. TCL26-01]
MAIFLLNDNFNSENNGVWKYNYTNLANWTITDGSLDLVGNGKDDYLPRNGLYLDLDGSTNNASRLESKTIFNFNTGDKVTLSFSLAGSQRGDTNSVAVSVGNLFSETFILSSSQPFTKFTRSFTITSAANGKLIFDHAGGDTYGLLLDNVELIRTASNSLEIANSQTEFSAIQGQNNWYYGYYNGPFNSSDFQLMTQFIDSSTWFVQEGTYWTNLRAISGHPNGKTTGGGRLPVEQWAVRRWVSEIDGTVDISGDLKSLSSSYGIVGRIFVDGVETWSQILDGGQGINYKVRVAVNKGSFVDFALDPRDSNDLYDTSEFTATIYSNTSPNNGTLVFSSPQFSVREDGTPIAAVTVTRTNGNDGAVSAKINLKDGTAKAPSDYNNTAITVNFADGETSKTVTIPIVNDIIDESNETITLTLSNPTGGATLGTVSNATVSIIDDDPQPIIKLSANQTIVEGLTNPQNAGYTISLSNPSSQTITVQYTTANGTATAGSDYTATTGTLTFNPGDTSKVINIPILNDSVNEVDETFTLKLTSPTNATLGTTNTVTTTITDTLSTAVTTTLPTNVENLTLTGTAAISGTGNAGNNILKGNSANNTLAGGDGNDTYAYVANTTLGTDTITETTTGGIDTINFTGSTVGVKVNLGVTTSQTVNSNLKLILSANNVIENATGGAGNDRLTGNSLNNILSGGSGNDQIQGLAGDDTLFGGAGDDILTGGAGRDRYLFQGGGVSTLGVDYISDFAVGQDLIVLSKASFTAVINGVGQALSDFAVVSDDEFVNASNARIVFSQGSGSVFYNQDSNVLGTGTVFEFARLGNPDITLSASDFSLIA